MATAEPDLIEQAPAIAPAVPAVVVEQQSLLPAIISLARDSSVDVSKLEALLRMQADLEERQAKKDFMAAFNRVAGRMPRVTKKGTISLGGKGEIAFARWEDMDQVIRPIITFEGFSLSFNTAPRQGGGLTVTGELLHVSGHTRTASIDLPADVGPGRNALQAAGSTLSYGKRYCAEMLLNIVREGQDDDGTKGGAHFIKGEQVEELQALIEEKGVEEDKFLAAIGVNHLGEIQAGGFTIAKNMLLQRKKREAVP